MVREVLDLGKKKKVESMVDEHRAECMSNWCNFIEQRLTSCEPVYVFELTEVVDRCGMDNKSAVKKYPNIFKAMRILDSKVRSPNKDEVKETCTIQLSECDESSKPRRGTIFRRRTTVTKK